MTNSIGRFRVIEQMGASATRAVHLTDDGTGCKRVVQVLCSEDESERVRFVEEGERIRQLAHAHIIETVETGVDGDGSPYVVFEHLQGISLADELARRMNLGVRRSVHAIRQIGVALAAAHVEGIVHGGIGVDSVFLVERDGDRQFVKLLGFGGADRADVPAPEQVRGEPIDERTDVWGVGALLYRMLTGYAPFAGAHGSPAWRNAITHGEPIELMRTDVPRDLREVIERCLAKDPADRFEDMAELVAALAPFERRFPRGSLTLAPPILNPAALRLEHDPAMASKVPVYVEPRSRWPWIVFAAAVLAGCIVGALVV